MAQNVLITPASTKVAFTDAGDVTTVLRTSSGRFELKDSGESNFVDLYANDIVLDGNLTVGGTTTTVNTSNILIEDPILQLAKGQTSGTPTVDIGFLGLRGASNNAAFIWDESDDVFAAILTTADGSGTTLTPASYANFKAGLGTFSTAVAVGDSYIYNNYIRSSNLRVTDNGYLGSQSVQQVIQIQGDGDVAIGYPVTMSSTLGVTGALTGTTFLIGRTTVAGVGASLGDINGAELGPGYLTLARDDTAEAKQIVFEKNDVEHSYIATNSTGIKIEAGRLTVDTDIYTESLTVDGSLYINDNTISHSGGDITLDAGGDIILDADGKVGIGTASPTYKLHVAATSTNLARFDGGNANNWVSITSGNSYSAGIVYENAGTGKWFVGHYNGNADGFSFYDASTSSVKLFIKEGGSVGIGTTGPSAKLHVNGTLWTQNEVYFKSIGGENRFDFLGTEK